MKNQTIQEEKFKFSSLIDFLSFYSIKQLFKKFQSQYYNVLDNKDDSNYLYVSFQIKDEIHEFYLYINETKKKYLRIVITNINDDIISDYFESDHSRMLKLIKRQLR